MNFERLRYLVALGRTGTVRGAADALHVSPGAVSKALAKLEEETGLRLIAPDGRGVVLTRDGEWLAQRGSHLVGEFAALGSDLKTRRDRDGGMCVASYDVFSTWFPSLLGRQYLPDMPLSFRDRWPGEVESAVSTGLSDVGITWIPVPTEGVEHLEAARAPTRVYVRRGAFAGAKVADIPFAIPTHPVEGSVGRYGPLDGWPTDGPPRTITIKASSIEARLEACRQGEVALVLPAFIVQLHNQRAKARDHLELHAASTKAVGKLVRRVYVVRRTAMGERMRERTNAVVAAVRTYCDATA
jgi:DNA-binding transcriptional LysR family regulator